MEKKIAKTLIRGPYLTLPNPFLLNVLLCIKFILAKQIGYLKLIQREKWSFIQKINKKNSPCGWGIVELRMIFEHATQWKFENISEYF